MTHIIILGKTRENKKFRPSAWPDMLAGHGSRFDIDKRLCYNNYLMPCNFQDGKVPALRIDKKLKKINPMLYKFVLDFARNNSLKMING